MGKLSTLLLASALLRITEDIPTLAFSSSVKDLPSLVREKRIIEDDDDVDDTSGSDNGLNTHNVNMTDKLPKHPGNHLQTRDEGEISSAAFLNQKSNEEYHRATKHMLGNFSIQHSLLGKYTYDNSKIKSKAYIQIKRKQHHKLDSPGVKYGWASQEISRAPPPSKEMQHRIRVRMKRKKRRRLRDLKRIAEAKQEETQKYEARKMTSPSTVETATVQNIKFPQKILEMTTPTSSITVTQKFNFVLSSLTPSTIKSIPDSSLALKHSLKSSREEDDSSTTSSSRRSKRFDDENAAKNQNSKIMPFKPLNAQSKVAQSSPSSSSSSVGLSSSLDEMRAEDLLRNFFAIEHAASPSNATALNSRSVNKGNSRDPRNNEEPKKSAKETTIPVAVQKKYAEKMRQEQINQDVDDYELKLLEFQKKKIEEKETRLKEQFALEKQKSKSSRERKLKQLDRKNREKEKEMHMLFDKFIETDKQNDNETLPHLKEDRKRSFINANFLEDKDDDVGDQEDEVGGMNSKRKWVSNRQKKENAQSIKEQRTINGDGDSEGNDKITEIAFYDQDEISNQNKNMNGLTHGKTTATLSKESGVHTDSRKNVGIKETLKETLKDTNEPLKKKEIDTTTDLMMNNTKTRKQDEGKPQSIELQTFGSLETDEKYRQVKEKENKVDDRNKMTMKNDDLMEGKQKDYSGDSDIQDFPKDLTTKIQGDKVRAKYIKEKSKKKEDEEGGADKEVDAQSTKKPIFTEIKDDEFKYGQNQEGGDKIEIKSEGELLVTKKKQKKLAEYKYMLKNEIRDNNSSNNNNSDNNNSDNNNSDNNNSNSNSSNGENNNQENDVHFDDKRLMYILTREKAKAPNTDTKYNNELGSNKMQNKQSISNKKINIGRPLLPKQMIINEGLKLKIKELHNRILNAHDKVSRELEQMEQELSNKFDTLQESMSTAKSLTSDVDHKIHNSVRNVLELATSSAEEAKAKLDLVQKAAVALNNIEEKMGANETRNFARVLKSKLPDLSAQKNKTSQKILAINKVITTVDGARIIALEKANRSYKAQANIENSMSEVAGNVLDELKLTEKELNNDVEMEIEDEIEADRKIRDAKSRNYRAAVKTAQALEKIEGYLKQLENEENRLRHVGHLNTAK